MGRRLALIEQQRPQIRILEIVRDVCGKFGLYIKVRLVISLIDTVVCYLFFRLIGLEEPLAWAILVGTMNFVPFIGPLIVAIIIGVFAVAQYGSLRMVFVAVGGTTAINFVLGSYIEPLMAGSALSMSPMPVLFSVFFRAIIWGIPRCLHRGSDHDRDPRGLSRPPVGQMGRRSVFSRWRRGQIKR